MHNVNSRTPPVEQRLGSDDAEDYDGSNSLQGILAQLAEHDWRDDGELVWTFLCKQHKMQDMQQCVQAAQTFRSTTQDSATREKESRVFLYCAPEGQLAQPEGPTSGAVEAPDWSPVAKCGGGLHGWLYGAGDHSAATITADSKWLVVEVASADVVMLGGKCKFPRATVRYVGGRNGAVDYLITHEPRSRNCAVIGASLTVGDGETVSVGSYGTATAGYSGTATAGDRGEIRIRWWDNKAGRYRTRVGYIGEDGLLPNVAYRLDSAHEFVRADRESA